MAKIFLPESVLDAARKRMSFVFDRFENIVVSVSSGKDSTALYGLALEEATRRNRRMSVFFLDQEAEYHSSIVQIRHMMDHTLVDPLWYQVPIKMTNATSYEQEFLYAWGPGEPWMRDKEPNSIHETDGTHTERFYGFFDWLERRTDDTAFLVGLRAEEALNRFRAVVKNPGFEDVLWSTATKSKGTYRFYPIFDWGIGDVWKFIADSNLPYNTIYDTMLRAGHNYYHTMRVSNLCHEKSFTCLASLQAMEPDTFDAVIKRLKGAHVAAIYAKEGMVMSADSRPSAFATWIDYRDYLLATIPFRPNRLERIVARFSKQPSDERTARQHVRQLLLNDWENNLPPVKRKEEERRANLLKWKEIL